MDLQIKQPLPDAAKDGNRHRPGWNRVLEPRTLSMWLILAGSLGLALAVYCGFLGESWIKYVAALTATWTGQALNLLGAATTVDGTILSSEGFAINIVAECTVVGPIILFVGAVVAYPAPLKAKGLGAMLGLAALTAVNVVRIMSLFLIGLSYPQYLSAAHLLVWQSAIIVMT